MKKLAILASIACLLFTGVGSLSAQTSEKKEGAATTEKKQEKTEKAGEKKAESKPAPKN